MPELHKCNLLMVYYFFFFFFKHITENNRKLNGPFSQCLKHNFSSNSGMSHRKTDYILSLGLFFFFFREHLKPYISLNVHVQVKVA